MNLTEAVKDLTMQIPVCNSHEEAIEILGQINDTLGNSPIALGFWYLWPTELYEAYLDAMRMYAWKCLHG